MKISKARMVELTKRSGNTYYFDENTIEFWNSILETRWSDDNQMFIESVDNFDRTKRMYMVKMIALDGNIITFSTPDKDPEHFPDITTAYIFRAAIRTLIPDDFENIQHCDYHIDPVTHKQTYKLINTNNETYMLDISSITTEQLQDKHEGSLRQILMLHPELM